MKSGTKRIISTLAICGALILEAGATAFSSIGKGIVHKVDAAEQSFYTLTFNAHKDSGKSGYASSGTFTDNDVGWKVDGANFSLADGFGFGGKSTGTLNRSFNTTTSMSEKVTKIEVVTGNMSAASATLSVKGYTNSGLSSGEVDYGSKSLAASSTFTFTSTSGLSNGYFKFSLGVQPNNSGSNKYVLLKTVTFYKDSGSTSTYTVTYDGNGNTGGSVPTDSTSYLSGASVTVKGNTGNLEKSGFTFNGWNTQSDGNGTSYSAGSTFNIAANTTLYANWKGSTPLGNSIIIDATTLNLGSDKIINDTVVGIYHFGGGGSGNGTKLQALAAGVSNNLSDNGTILIGKSGAYIYNSSPLVSDISSIDIYCNGGSASTNVVVAVKCGSSQLSSEIGSSETVSFKSQLSNNDTVFSNTNTIPDGSKYFRLQVMSAHNAQIQIKLNLKSVQPVTVTNTFTNISSTGASTATTGTDYTATLSATNGKVLPNTITVKNGTSTLEMGSDKDYTYNPSNGSLVIFGSKITDNIEIIAAGVDAKTLTGISVSNYKTKLYVGHEFEFGGTVTAHYDGAADEVVTALASFSGYNMTAASNYVVTVTFEGKTATYNLIVEAVVLDSISIATPAKKTTFLKNAMFTSEGLVVAGLNNDGSEAAIVQENVVVTPPDMTILGEKDVDVMYQDIHTSYKINVIDPSSLRTFSKVTSTSDISKGEYLIVYETDTSNAKVFNGVDATGEYGNAEISSGKITETEPFVTVVLEESTTAGAYYLKVKGGTNDGKYMYGSSGSTVTNFGDSGVDAAITVSDGDASIVSNTSVMRFNTNTGTGNDRFRFYKSSSTSFPLVQLYKLEQKFDVTFNLQGHGSAIDKQTVAGGGLATKPTDPTATGYVFGGWYKEAGCENAWDFATDKVTEATELFAKWTLGQYDLTYDPANGGSKTSEKVNYNTTVTVAAAPSFTGHTFGGWSDGSTTYQPGNTFPMPGEAVTLTAQWTTNEHNVTFYRGEDDVVGPNQYAFGADVPHPNPLPTKEDNTFIGWSLSEGSDEVAFSASEETFPMIDSDVNFYPVFSSNPVVTGIELSSTFDSIYITNSNDVFSAEVTVSKETAGLSTDVVWTVSPTDAGTFSNGSTSMTTASNVSPEFTASKAYEGDNKVTITATSDENDSFAKSFEFNINNPTDLELVGIEISGTASKTKYYNTDTDDNVDPTGLTVTATYKSSEQAATYTTTKDVTDDVAWSLVKSDPAHLVATFEGETDTYDGITIVEDYISSIYVVDGTGKRDFILGDEFTTVDDEDNDIVVMGVHADGKTADSVIDSDDYTVDSSKYEQYTVPGDEGATYEIGVSLNGTAISTSYNVTVNKFVEQEAGWQLVTSNDELEDDAQYLLVGVNSSNYYAMKAYDGSSNNFKGTSVTAPVDNKIVFDPNAEYAAVTLNGGDGDWTFFDGDKYLYAACGTGTSNYMKGASNTEKLNSHFSIDVAADGSTTIVSLDTSLQRPSMRFNYNGGTTLFSCYETGKQAPIYLYKYVEAQSASIIQFEPTYEGGSKHIGDTLTIEDFDFEDKVLFNDGESHLEDDDVSLEIKSGAKLETTSNTVVVAIKRGGIEVATKSFTISATKQYGATLDVNIAGSVDADLSAKVEEGETFEGTIMPTEHYNIDSVVVNDSTGATVASNYNTSTGVLTVENVADNLTVVVTTSPKAVVTSLLENGVAATHYQLTEETGAVYGETYEATLSAINQDTVKYDISSVVVRNNGVIVTGAYDETTGKIKVEGVNGAIVVSVTCTDHKYTASLDAESEHVALVNTSEIAYGATYTTTFTVDEHYQIDSVSVTDSKGNPVASTFSGGTLTVGNVTDDLTISVETSVITHTLSFDYDDTKIELSSEPETITELQTIKITISPKPGYKVDSVTVNDVTATLEDGVLTLTGITANTTIVINEAEADPLAYTISHDENSHFTTDSEQYSGQIGYGGSLVEKIVADEGYRVDETCISVTNEDGDVAFSFVNGVLTVTGVTKDITVTVVPIQTFNISLPEFDNFVINAIPTQVDYNGSTSVGLSVDDHYHVTLLGYTIGGGEFVDLTDEVVGGTHLFIINGITGNVEVTLEVAIDTYTVTTTPDTNSYINVDTSVAHGDDLVVEVGANEHYHLVSITYTIEGETEAHTVDIEDLVEGKFTIEEVTGNVVVTASSEHDECNISYVYDDNSSVSGNPTVDYDGTLEFTVSVDDHYHIKDIVAEKKGGGEYLVQFDSEKGVYYIENVTTNVKIIVTSEIDSYSISGIGDDNVSVSPSEGTVNHGSSVTFTVTPSENYHVDTVTYVMGENDPVTATLDQDGKFTIEEVTGNVVVTASSEHDECNVSYVKDDHSTVTGNLTVAYDGRLEFEVSKDDHYNVNIIAEKKGGGEYLVQFDSEKGVYYIENVTVDVRIVVTSTIETNNVTYHTDDLSINYDGPNEVNYGENLVISDISTSEYHHVVVSYKIDGMEEAQVVEVIGGVATIENVTGPIDVYFSNEIDTVNVTVNGEHYSVEETIEDVDYGGKYSNSFTADAGYYIEKITYKIGDGAEQTVIGSDLVIENVTDTLTITVYTKENKIVSIDVTNYTDETYVESTYTFDGIVTATMADGSTKTLEASEYSVSELDTSETGTKTITITAGDVTKDIEVNVIEEPVPEPTIVSIAASDYATEVVVGNEYSFNGKVTATLSDGSTVVLNATDYTVSKADTSVVGEISLTISCGDVTTEIKVNVIEEPVVVTEIIVGEYNDTVDQGKEYVFDGDVTIKFSDGSTKTDGYTVSEVDTSKHGEQKAKVSYGGVEVEITIHVVQTKTEVEPYLVPAIAGGAVIGLSIVGVALFFFFKKFKI